MKKSPEQYLYERKCDKNKFLLRTFYKRSCHGKSVFKTEEEATNCGGRRKSQTSYYCILCNNWHLGTHRNPYTTKRQLKVVLKMQIVRILQRLLLERMKMEDENVSDQDS